MVRGNRSKMRFIGAGTEKKSRVRVTTLSDIVPSRVMWREVYEASICSRQGLKCRNVSAESSGNEAHHVTS